MGRCVLVVGDGFDVGVVCVMMSQHWGGGVGQRVEGIRCVGCGGGACTV